MHADRTNRTMMLVFALLLIAVGLDAGVASIGGYGTGIAGKLVKDELADEFAPL